jgi:LPS sulfotransferase NodH
MTVTRNDHRPFVVFFQGRSGSTYLTQALDSHPNVRCEMERLVSLRKSGPQEQINWIRTFLAGSRNGTIAAVGFKTKLDDVLNPKALADLLQKIGVRIILLSRLNVVKMVVSWFNSERLFEMTGDWNQYPPASALEPFEIDLEKFDRRLGLVLHGKDRLEAYVHSLNLRLLQICYEDLLTNQQQTIGRVCEFLDVEPMPLKGQCVKTTNDDLRKVIANFDALHRLYEGTHYQQMLEEVLVADNGNDS